MTGAEMTRFAAGPARTAPVKEGWVLGVVMTGVLMTAVDTTIVLVALPGIERSLRGSLTSVVWVAISYLLVTTLLATQSGRLGDMYGRERMYKAGFAVFVAASALCGAAFSIPSLVAFRLLQGVGAALVTANGGAIVSEVFPRARRGKAFGYIGISWSLGAILGVVAGGLIVTFVSWRWVFLVNVPIGVVVFILAGRVLRASEYRRRHRLDVTGMCLLGSGLLGVLLAGTRLAASPPDPLTVILGAGGAVFLGAFALAERVADEPMLRLSLFRTPAMAGSLLAALFQGLANYAVLFLVILYLQGARGLSPVHASLLMAPGYVMGALLSPVSGRLADRYAPAFPATVGLAAEIAALLMYSRVSLDGGLWLISAASLTNGIGLGLFVPANNSAVMKASPPDLFGVSSGMLRTFASVGWLLSFSTAILAASRSVPRALAIAVFVDSKPMDERLAAAFTRGLHASFYVLAVIMALAAVLSVARTVGGTGAEGGS